MADAGQKHDRDGQPINHHNAIQNAIHALARCEEAHQAEIKALQEAHQAEIKALQTENTRVRFNNTQLWHRITKLEREIHDLKVENAQLRSENEHMRGWQSTPQLPGIDDSQSIDLNKGIQNPSQPQAAQSSPSHGVFVDMDPSSCADKYWPWIRQLATRVGYTAEVLPLSAQPPSDTSQTLVFYVVYSSGPRLEGFANQVRYMELRQQYENVVLLVLRHGNNPTAFEAEGIINDDKWPSGVKGIKGALQFVFKGDIYSPEKCELLEVTQTYNATNLENLTKMVNAIKSS